MEPSNAAACFQDVLSAAASSETDTTGEIFFDFANQDEIRFTTKGGAITVRQDRDAKVHTGAPCYVVSPLSAP
eukprot:SAG31_NODE_1345_length_8699_cov_7.525116_6_plen_73_part_00